MHARCSGVRHGPCVRCLQTKEQIRALKAQKASAAISRPGPEVSRKFGSRKAAEALIGGTGRQLAGCSNSCMLGVQAGPGPSSAALQARQQHPAAGRTQAAAGSLPDDFFQSKVRVSETSMHGYDRLADGCVLPKNPSRKQTHAEELSPSCMHVRRARRRLQHQLPHKRPWRHLLLYNDRNQSLHHCLRRRPGQRRCPRCQSRSQRLHARAKQPLARLREGKQHCLW